MPFIQKKAFKLKTIYFFVFTLGCLFTRTLVYFRICVIENGMFYNEMYHPVSLRALLMFIHSPTKLLAGNFFFRFNRLQSFIQTRSK